MAEVKETAKKVTPKKVAEKTEVKAEPKKAAPAKTETKAEAKVEAKKAPAKAPAKKASKASSKVYFLGTGRRKKSIARVRITPVGTGLIVVNDKPIEEYFASEVLKLIVNQPLVLTNSADKHDIYVNVYGGGLSGQAGAVRHGIARALVKYNEALKPELKKAGFLTRDSRAKERKKYGLKKARKAPQFSKR